VPSILVVDDDPDIRLLLRLELANEGHQILEAGNGQQALDTIAAERPDLVVLDMMMPVLDGWGVLDALDPSSSPPVIVITALATDGDRHVADALERGALDVIAKPFDPGWLVGLVDAVLLVDPDERDEYRRLRLARAQHG
jgi:DNA-binding response OmpR family regulator